MGYSHGPSNSRWMGIGGLLVLEIHVYLFTIYSDLVAMLNTYSVRLSGGVVAGGGL
jgi:hypothetical protein